MATTKSRREIFEEQLRDLQKDISSLSSKLSIPPMVTTTRIGSSPSLLDSKVDISIVKDLSSSSIVSNQESKLPSDKEAYLRQQVEQFSNDLTRAYKERDDTKRQVEQLTKENEELRKGLPEHARLKALYESLKQDYEALKTSFESSERIRLQQKELIQVLRSSNLGVESSAASVQSISSISQKGGDGSSVHSLTAMIGSSQPTNSVFSGMQGYIGDQWNYANPSQVHSSMPMESQFVGASSENPPPITAMKARRSVEKRTPPTTGRKQRVDISSNSLTKNRSTSSNKKESATSKLEVSNKKKKRVSNSAPSAAAYQRITQDISRSSGLNANSFQDILSQNQSLLSTSNLQALQNFHNNNAPPTPFMQQMMQNQAATEQSSSLLAAIQAQHMQQGMVPPHLSSYNVPQNPEVSAARGNVAATLASAGKPPRYPSTPTPAVTGTMFSNQPIFIPTTTSTSRVNTSVTNNVREIPVARSTSPANGTANRKSAISTSGGKKLNNSSNTANSKYASAKKTASAAKSNRKSTIESAGRTKVLYRPLPSPVSTFGISKRL